MGIDNTAAAEDTLSAAVAKIKSDHRQHVSVNFPAPGLCVSRCAGPWPCQAWRAASAVEAVLKLHALTALHRHTEPCDRHRYRGIAERGACPDCRVIEWTGCETCRDEFGNPACPEDCRERAVILAALTGRDKADG